MSQARETVDAAVIGAGFYGCEVARFLKRHFPGVVLIEKGDDILGRASANNQARVHGGYHYPRSLTTGLRSQANYQVFVERYRSCVEQGFTSIYAIARDRSYVTAAQFRKFCEVIHAPCRQLQPGEEELFDPQFVEAAFETREAVFDADRLREAVRRALEEEQVELQTDAEVTAIRQEGEGMAIHIQRQGAERTVRARRIFLCVYAATNDLLRRADVPALDLVYEQAELVCVDVPPVLQDKAVTVMCGPFFSVTPFPTSGKHCLSHVRYTPHTSWGGTEGDGPSAAPASRVAVMLKDAERYMPCMRDSRVDRSIWETKVILPRNERNDGRPILFARDHGMKNMHCIIGGKIDNLFDVLHELEQLHSRGEL